MSSLALAEITGRSSQLLSTHAIYERVPCVLIYGILLILIASFIQINTQIISCMHTITSAVDTRPYFFACPSINSLHCKKKARDKASVYLDGGWSIPQIYMYYSMFARK